MYCTAADFISCEFQLIWTSKAAIFLWSVLQTRLNWFTRHGLLASCVDFLLNVGGIFLATTIYSSAPILLNVLLLSPAILLLFFSRPNAKVPLKPPPGDGSAKLDSLPPRPFIAAYRGGMMIITCLSILAVDFRVFPRRFAKVETWGTSLMDLGVGSFVFSAGVVSARSLIRDRLAGKAASFSSRFLVPVKHSLSPLVLGLIRLYGVKGMDLAEHTTEYGVHWNFFFTLALLPLSMALLQFLPSTTTMLALTSLAVAVCYEMILDFTRLTAYIIFAPRTDFISQNREGIFSFFGYLAIFVAGRAIGFDILFRAPDETQNRAAAVAARRNLLIRLIFYTVLLSLSTALTISSHYGLDLSPSRRLANLPYVLWVSAFNCTQITAFCAIETFIFPGVHKATDKVSESREVDKATSPIIRAFNRNGLAIFLVANLLTGQVNFRINTLTVSNSEALAILSAYVALLTVIAIMLDRWNISIKL